MSQPFPGLQDFLGMPAVLDMQRQMSRLAPPSGARAHALQTHDPVLTAATFGALLTAPELQSNGARLEMLVHQALGLGQGTKAPTARWVASQFKRIGRETVGRLEDPAEDVFVTYCATSQGGFRVLEGIWESAGFFLQRFVNVIEGMPDVGQFGRLKTSVLALLRLSDLVCERAGLDRYILGGAYPLRELPPDLSAQIPHLAARVRFTDAELAAAGITHEALRPFRLLPSAQDDLLDAELGHSALERRPIVRRAGELFLVLPTAVSAAIRRLVIETVDASDQREVFLEKLGEEYLHLLERLPLIGGGFAGRLHFDRGPTSAMAGISFPMDRGRYLNLVLVLDTLEGFELTGLTGQNPDPDGILSPLKLGIAGASRHAREDPDFVEGLTLFITCGVGRASAYSIPRLTLDDWRLEVLSASELHTLGWAEGFTPLSLFRMLDGRDALARANVRLHNLNGLLNLAAAVRTQGGHMIPHRDVPDDLADRSRPLNLMLAQNALLGLRHEVASDYDVHVQRDVYGRWQTVRRRQDRVFAEDNLFPVYVSEEDRARRGSAGLLLTEARAWWFDIVVPDDLHANAAHDYWLTLVVWLTRSIPILEGRFPALVAGPLLVEADFTAAARARGDEGGGPDYQQVRANLTFAIEAAAPIARIAVGEAFESGGFHVENVAERALVGVIVDAVAGLAGEALEWHETLALVHTIAPDPKARQGHRFKQAKFLDFVRDDLAEATLTIDRADEALHRLGLGWRSRELAQGPWLRGKADCLAFLNRTTQILEESLCAELRAFDRTDLVRSLLYAHEAAAADGQRWKRTSGAILALRQDEDAVRGVFTEKDAERAELSQTSRTLIELVVCEAPLSGGRRPGELDLSRLLAKMSLLLTFSGWSGAIRWNVMEARLKVAALGDILANLDFVDDILVPFSRAFSDVSVDAAVARYADNLREAKISPTVELESDAKFYAALRDEVGASFDDYRLFIDCVENLGVKSGKAVLTLKRSALIGLGNEDRTLSAESSQQILDALTLTPRAGWRENTEGIDRRELQLWRYRRRRSVLRQPLIQIDDAADPTVLVAPGLLRQGFLYTVGNFYDGSFPDWQLSPAMRSWGARAAGRRGRVFSVAIGEKLKAEGWSIAEPDLKVTKLLRKGFDRDYGDVDVLAWRADSGRVLVIECKDLQFKKTLGEVSEQLSDFQGETVDGKRDDLKKHLDRMELLRTHLPEVARFVGWSEVGALESHLVFKHPVPMQFALDHLRTQVHVSTAQSLLETLEN